MLEQPQNPVILIRKWLRDHPGVTTAQLARAAGMRREAVSRLLNSDERAARATWKTCERLVDAAHRINQGLRL